MLRRFAVPAVMFLSGLTLWLYAMVEIFGAVTSESRDPSQSASVSANVPTWVPLVRTAGGALALAGVAAGVLVATRRREP